MSGELVPVPTSMRIVLLAMCFALACATYWLVERPVRRRWRAKPAAAWLLAATALLAIAAVIAAPLQKSLSGPHAATIQAQLAGPSWSFVRNDWCERRHGKGYRLFCIQSRPGVPTLLLFGNSFANHLYPGFATSPLTRGHNVLSITTCDPGLTDDKGCAVQERIAASPGLKVAIVSSLWPRFDASGHMIENRAGRIVPLPGQPGAARYGRVLAERLRRLRALGLAVVVVGPKPALGYNASECFPRPMRRAAHDCRLSAAEAQAQTDAASAMLMQAAASVPGVRYFDLRPLFCGPDGCNFVDGDGLPLLRDKVHLSELGSRRVAEALVRDALAHGMDLRWPAR
jgi:lysophospholipase L1-like esterase